LEYHDNIEEENYMKETESVPRFAYLLHPRNTALVTCCDADGKPNIIAIAWLTPVSVDPPLLTISVHPTRYSYGLIAATGEFIVNMASYEIAEQTLYCGRVSGRDVEKFSATGLNAAPAQRVRPPIIEECLAHVECRVVKEVQAGDHNLFIGEVLAAYATRGVLDGVGQYDLSLAHPLLHLGSNRFATPGEGIVEPQEPM
jgi:flavin reductase (DIM6/NTAB) family NADH-FMN oxidoreductase RutF